MLKKGIINSVILLLFSHAALFAQPKTYKFINGQWFNGKSFVKKTMYSVNGFFTEKDPASGDSVIDLQNKFAIPPFSEAHTHHLEGIGMPPQQLINSYLKDGVFYVKNPNNVNFFTNNIRPFINKPTSLDASFANGGLTASEGHPMTMFEDQIRPSIEPMTGKTNRGWFHGKAYFTIDSEEMLNEKWDSIMAGKPDFIKVYLANSEDYGKEGPVSKYQLRKGLNPALLPAIVLKAHKAGLRVAAHVETTADFRIAINAGVDELAHMPGFYLFDKAHINRYILTDADAKLAADKKVWVTTTLSSKTLVEDKTLLEQVAQNQKQNLLLLKKYGVKLAIGSDHADSPLPEVEELYGFKIFDNISLLTMWCTTSAQNIFPGRKIGYLKEEYEASFLLLDGNPLTDFWNVKKISLLVKQGNILEQTK
ncbi:MAG: amidohydrolase family protein [Ferruginibacter sp.]